LAGIEPLSGRLFLCIYDCTIAEIEGINKEIFVLGPLGKQIGCMSRRKRGSKFSEVNTKKVKRIVLEAGYVGEFI